MPADNKHAAAKNKLEGRSARPNGSLSKNLRRLPRAFNAYARASVRRKEDFRFLTGTACYVVERLVDRAAREMKLDPVALRRRNFVPNDAYPYTTPVALTYNSVDYFKTLDMRSRRPITPVSSSDVRRLQNEANCAASASAPTSRPAPWRPR
jgi:CO/xanthine dehydrogenase Mo-binding subunit